MRLFLFFLVALSIGNVQAQQSCLDLFQLSYFEKSFENNNAKRLMEMFAWHSTASPSMHPTIERQIFKIYREWERAVSDSERVLFPVRPLYMMPRYYGENFWKATPEMALAGKVAAPYFTQSERAELQVEMTAQGLVFSSTQEPVVGVLKGDFVVSMDRKIYILHDREKRRFAPFIKHSSILMSAPVLYAGEIHVDSQGQILKLTRNSGHYQPNAKHFRWVKEFLTEMGLQLPVARPASADAEDLL